MKDRQPTQVLANGAIRYGIYNADGSLNHYEYMKREDAPTVEGTPLNKANLLSDATAAKIWPKATTRPEDPTVNDALVELQKGTSKVGDILMSVRAKPSDAWLLCNGQAITKSTYPKLFDILRPAASPAPWTSKSITGVDRDTSRIKYTNGKWFAFAYDSSNAKMHMYVSDDADTWADYPFNLELGSNVYIDGVAICYHELKNVYCMAIVRATSSTSNYCISYTISEDLQTVTEGGWIWSSGSSSCSKLELYVSSYGNVYCVKYTYATANGGAYADAFKDTGTFNWSRIYYVDAASYDESTGHFCWTDDRNIYSAEELGGNSAEYLIGTIPNAVIPSSIQKSAIHKYICAATNTIIAIYQDGGLKYAYTIDNSTTWHSGAKVISANSADYIDLTYGFEFVVGFLLFTARLDGGSTRYICSASDPEDQIYKTAGIFSGALSPAALAANPPAAGAISICNYGDLAKPVPTIVADSRSHAYIKALEE